MPMRKWLPVVAIVYSLSGSTVRGDIIVSNASDTVNGDVSTPDTLATLPGHDGVSLREALLAAQGVASPQVISFDASLREKSILLSSSLPSIHRNDLSLIGLLGDDFRPVVSIDGSGIENPTQPAILRVHASRIQIKGIRFKSAKHPLQAALIIDDGAPEAPVSADIVEDVVVEDCEFDNEDVIYPSGFGPAGILMGTNPPSRGAVVRRITVRRTEFRGYTGDTDAILAGGAGSSSRMESLLFEDNDISNSTFGIEVGGGHPGPGNVVRDVVIRNNRISVSGAALPIAVGGVSSLFERLTIIQNTIGPALSGVLLGPVEGPDARMTDVTISANAFVRVELPLAVSTRGSNTSLNGLDIAANTFTDVGSPGFSMTTFDGPGTISDIQITDNGFPTSVHIGPGGSSTAIEELHIERNRFRGVDAVLAVNGGDSGTDNVVRNVRIINNECDARMSLVGGAVTATRSRLEDVVVSNNTIVVQQGYALQVVDNDEGALGNSATDIRLINSILFSPEADLVGKLTSADVHYTRTASPGLSGVNGNFSDDPRFVSGAAEFRVGAGSPAIDAGHPSECPSTDLRGFARPIDGDRDRIARCDMGAYEYFDSSRRRSVRH
jgi:hypothetical protein